MSPVLCAESSSLQSLHASALHCAPGLLKATAGLIHFELIELIERTAQSFVGVQRGMQCSYESLPGLQIHLFDSHGLSGYLQSTPWQPGGSNVLPHITHVDGCQNYGPLLGYPTY